MAAPGTPIEIHLISDSTGDTAARVARAAQTQFSGHRTTVVRHPRVTTVDDVPGAHRSRQSSRPSATCSRRESQLPDASWYGCHCAQTVTTC